MSSKAPEFTELNDLASASIGGKVLFATDDWFAAAENLLQKDPPVWKDGFTEYGKWMDGWETRRKRTPGHDWCVIELGLAGTIHGVEIDTRFFTGNFAPRASVQAARLTNPQLPMMSRPREPMGKCATTEDLEKISAYDSANWETIVPFSPLGAGYAETSRNFFPVSSTQRFTHVRLNMFPDGGIARLRVFGIAVPELPKLTRFDVQAFRDLEAFRQKPELQSLDQLELVDLVAMENGGVCVGYSDAHYGHPRNMIGCGRGINMGDGWETARHKDRPAVLTARPDGVLDVSGSDWCVLKLGLPGMVQLIEIDTHHFKGNFPDSVEIEGTHAQTDDVAKMNWSAVLPSQKLGAHRRDFFRKEIVAHGTLTHVKVTMRPDGGISRVRLFGTRPRL